MKNSVRAKLLVILKLFSAVNQILPKKKNRILFYTNESFNDNCLALFAYMIENGLNKKYSIYYCAKSNPLPKSFYDGKLKRVHFVGKLRCFLVFLRSKYVFYDVGTTRITPSKKQVVIQMWHGTPLKKIGRSTVRTSKNDIFNCFTYVTTASANFLDIFTEAFECPKDKVHVMGYPRNDYLFRDCTVPGFDSSRTNILWMPTFRKSMLNDSVKLTDDHSISFLKNLDDISELNNFLKKNNVSLYIKFHPISVQNVIDYPELENIHFINNEKMKELNVMNYSFVGKFDALLTDYSSVYFDYLLLDRPVGFVFDDLEDYSRQRGFTFRNPQELMPGPFISCKEQFYEFVKDLIAGRDEYAAQRKKVMEFANTATTRNDACEKMLNLAGICSESGR